MDWLTFLATIIDALAWPLVVLLAVLILRKPLSDLIPLLRKIKWKDFEADFGRELSIVGETIRGDQQMRAPIPANGDTPPQLLSSKSHEYAELSKLSPRTVVLESWHQVESAIRKIVSTLDITEEKIKSSPPIALVRLLEKNEIITYRQRAVFKHLSNLRNMVAHNPEFELSQENALEYADFSSFIIENMLRIDK